MRLRKYRTSDCEHLAELFYHTVHSVSVKDYTKEGLLQQKEWSQKKWEQMLL